jgi:hypothetical protein
MQRHIDRHPDTTRRRPALIAALVLSLTGFVATDLRAEAPDAGKPARLFASEDTLEVTMTAPWSELQRQKSYQGAYPAELRYRDDNGSPVVLAMTVERRGVKRQQICNFPPIKLRFEKDAVKGTAFRGQKSLKLVTHCESPDRYEQYYILEMLAYRIYNLLTDVSFRVRPLQVTYVDSADNTVLYSKFAFLVEDDSDLAKRNSLKKLDIPRISPSRLDSRQSSLMSLFQYMIGNVDWAATMGPDPAECCHNIQLLAPEPFEPKDFALPVPYDFDSSGLVNARYAVPHESLAITSVTQRLYRGYCMHNATLDDARQQILASEAAIRALISNESRLTSSSRKQASRYLGDFFETARNPDRFEKYVTGKCRK